MPTELLDLIADLEISITDTVDRIDEAQVTLLYVAVLDLEQRLEVLHDALALTTDIVLPSAD